MTQQISNLEQFTQQVRRDILRMVQQGARDGLPGGVRRGVGGGLLRVQTFERG